MGSLEIKSDQKPEHENVSSGSELMVDSPTTSDRYVLELISEPTSTSDSDAGELIVYSPTAFSEDDASGSGKKVFQVASFSSSISSSDSRLEDPLQDFDNEHGENGNNASESPPIQVMERPTTGKYRIPSSVFARKKSTGTEWGMASNESLFSINIGGMSFCNLDSLNWKSGELDLDFALEPSVSGKPINSPYEDQFKDDKPLEVERTFELDETGKPSESDASEKRLSGDNKIQSLSEISSNHQSSVADEPVKPNSQENREDQGHKFVVDEQTSPFSAESESRDSFAFPILTADTKTVSEMPKSEPHVETEPQLEPEKHSQPSGPKTDTPAASWTRCFGCCMFCC